MPNVTSFDRIADAAARLFLADGYAGVSLRAIADELSIKPASLYYHCPRGKTELFARALSAYFGGYRVELAAAAGRARFPAAVIRMAHWMLEHPPVDMQRIIRSDLPHLAAEDAEQVVNALHESVLSPFADAFTRAQDAGEVDAGSDAMVAASVVVALVDGLGFQHLPADRPATDSELQAARRNVNAGLRMLNGLS